MRTYDMTAEFLAPMRIESFCCSYLCPSQILNHSLSHLLDFYPQLNAKPASSLRKFKNPTPPPQSYVSRQHTMPTPSARPAILDSRIVRIICPLKPPSRRLTTATHRLPRNQPWSHPPASISIDNDQVARLASQPLHSLTLADLVR